MDSIKQVKPKTNGQNQVLKSNGCKPKIYTNSCHTHSLFEVLQSLRKEEVLCDIRLETDDGVMVCGHRLVLVSASPYFRAMFTSFNGSKTDLVNIKEFDSNVLKLLIDYIYTGKIEVTEQNVVILLPAANLLQLDYVKNVCVEFLKTQLNYSNYFGINRFADLHNCKDLLSSCDAYIKKEFRNVVKTDEFLSLSSKEVIKLISRNNIYVPFEEKVYECVINWVKHKLDSRYDCLPKLMEHVRLPLVSIQYISKNVVDEQLLKNSPKCTEFLVEALHFHALTKQLQIFIPQTIRNTPRHLRNKVILISSTSPPSKKLYIFIYDPETNLLQIKLEMIKGSTSSDLVLIKKHLVFSFSDRIVMINLSSQSAFWVPVVDMLVDRSHFGIGILSNCIYAVGGIDRIDDGKNDLNSVEVYDDSIKKWRLLKSMSTKRSYLGVGVMNNLLYAVGGYNNECYLKSVECYDPRVNTWTTVENMSVSRIGPGVGVVNGILYVVGGYNEFSVLQSAEAYRPTTGVWYSISNMHLCRKYPRVVTLNGLLYVIGGFDKHGASCCLTSVEVYNPDTDAWSIETFSSTNIDTINGAVVIDRSVHFNNI